LENLPVIEMLTFLRQRNTRCVMRKVSRSPGFQRQNVQPPRVSLVRFHPGIFFCDIELE